MLRACHGAEESLTPHAKRESTRTAVRRMARGAPKCDTSADSWPGEKALKRSQVVLSAGGLRADPLDALQDKVAFFDAKLVPGARVRASVQRVSSPPQYVASCPRSCAEGVRLSAPDSPSCAMGLPRDCAKLVSKGIEPVPWWDVECEIGRRQYDAQYSAARHSLFETFAPSERALDPAYRFLLRARASQLGVIPATKGNPGATGVAFETTSRAIPSPVSAEEVGHVRMWSRFPFRRFAPSALVWSCWTCPEHPYWSRWVCCPAWCSRRSRVRPIRRG